MRALRTALLAALLLAGCVLGGDDGFTGDFEVTSGAWAEAGSGARTDAPVFRARSERNDLGDVAVDLRFRIDGYAESEGEHDWDGVHVGVRYASPDDLYYVSVARRDGTIAVKRKAGGTYETLATAPLAVSTGAWHDASVSVAGAGERVTVTLRVNGEEVLRAVDDEAPLEAAGRIVLRSDNVDVAFGDLDVREMR